MTATMTVWSTLPGVPAASHFSQVIADDLMVAELDPLGADMFFATVLPELNRPFAIAVELRVRHLRSWAERLLPTDGEIAVMTRFEAMAATRDLGMVAASLRRCGREPGFVPALERALLSLSLVTGEVPGLTVWSYGGLRNPVGKRERRFTPFARERLFIRDIRHGMEQLPYAIDLLTRACALSIYDNKYASMLNAAEEYLESMVDSIHSSRRNVSPQFFTFTMRPFFEPMMIGGKLRKSAGAAQMPFIWVDLLLWAMEGLRWPYIDYGMNRWTYWDYFEENMEYQPECLRELVAGLVNLESLLGKARRELAVKGLNDVAMRSLVALHGIFRVTVKFRAPHVVVAELNMALRPPGSVGSGGYQASLLRFLLAVVTAGRDEVRSWLPSGAVSG